MVTFFLDTGKESGEDGFMVHGFALPQVLQSSVGETNILIGCRVWLHEVDATSLDGEQVIGFHSETPDLADKEGAVVKASDRDKHLVHGVHLNGGGHHDGVHIAGILNSLVAFFLDKSEDSGEDGSMVNTINGEVVTATSLPNWNGCSHHDDVHIAGLLNNLVAFFLDTNEDNGEDGSMVGEMHLIEDRCQIHKVAGKEVNTINGEFVVATSMTSSAWMSSLEWATLRMKGVEHAGLMGWRHLQDHDKANGHVGDEEVLFHEVDAASLDSRQVVGFDRETPDLADKEGAVVKASDRDKHLSRLVTILLNTGEDSGENRSMEIQQARSEILRKPIDVIKVFRWSWAVQRRGEGWRWGVVKGDAGEAMRHEWRGAAQARRLHGGAAQAQRLGTCNCEARRAPQK
uniref:Uncharacterized protein n=1 Tax=Oryza barthii TaxID=65489 RepID=A0A0D3H0Q2_9ORYZ